MEANPPPGMELRAIELPTPDGVIQGQVAVTTGPMRLTGLVRIAYELTGALEVTILVWFVMRPRSKVLLNRQRCRPVPGWAASGRSSPRI